MNDFYAWFFDTFFEVMMMQILFLFERFEQFDKVDCLALRYFTENYET